MNISNKNLQQQFDILNQIKNPNKEELKLKKTIESLLIDLEIESSQFLVNMAFTKTKTIEIAKQQLDLIAIIQKLGNLKPLKKTDVFYRELQDTIGERLAEDLETAIGNMKKMNLKEVTEIRQKLETFLNK